MKKHSHIFLFLLSEAQCTLIIATFCGHLFNWCLFFFQDAWKMINVNILSVTMVSLPK